ncbi:nuclear transport factor 2 family protein [Ningiella sp. W23]|uniref:nuclear transport factor 2 family protein n=1 Tax=Ningiella sp. W23 TaxID=3023715 RepID=UPI003756BF71
MQKSKLIILFLALFISISCLSREFSARELAAKNIVDAVNAKDSEMYVKDLADDVVVTMYNGKVILEGLKAVKENRTKHFDLYPDARNELVHIVQIDDRVVMHDLVWLSQEQSEPADIVEIFTFKGSTITQIDVIQSQNLNIKRD